MGKRTKKHAVSEQLLKGLCGVYRQIANKKSILKETTTEWDELHAQQDKLEDLIGDLSYVLDSWDEWKKVRKAVG